MTDTTKQAAAPGPAYGWYLASGLVVAALAGTGMVLYPDLPETLPVHWNGAGKADSFAHKSFWSVFSVPLITAALVLFLLGTAAVTPRAAASGHLQPDAGHVAQTANIRATQFFLGATTFSLSLLLAWFALRGWLLPPDGSVWEFALPTLALILAMAGTGMLALRRYRREVSAAGIGTGTSLPKGTDSSPVAGMADRSHWRAGIYINRTDPRILVPKRLGAGWTVNAGRPAGLAFYLVILLISAAALVAGIALPLLAR
ncbi:DUF1648 domain-containing protein [Arthrobacter sp. zg-Y769]|uniref:DUF1648 domain-containing protein n=1 Tax=Arthrobacter sp. zg-Y769 TaxID=2894191 RepID=UPI001E5CE0E7|nr:DUF1648 domain-containing protein [Arthrobacter sp. zg-Y769]MCC9203847.1 DUF1648 domain-containing protein [Arthrobacter sp. zg-Y769]